MNQQRPNFPDFNNGNQGQFQGNFPGHDSNQQQFQPHEDGQQEYLNQMTGQNNQNISPSGQVGSNSYFRGIGTSMRNFFTGKPKDVGNPNDREAPLSTQNMEGKKTTFPWLPQKWPTWRK